MAAARWDMTAVQMSWVMNEPGENPFRVKVETGKVVEFSASELAKMFFGKVDT